MHCLERLPLFKHHFCPCAPATFSQSEAGVPHVSLALPPGTETGAKLMGVRKPQPLIINESRLQIIHVTGFRSE